MVLQAVNQNGAAATPPTPQHFLLVIYSEPRCKRLIKSLEADGMPVEGGGLEPGPGEGDGVRKAQGREAVPLSAPPLSTALDQTLKFPSPPTAPGW